MNAQRIIVYLLVGAVVCVIAFVALHVVAVGGIYAFNSFKASHPEAAPRIETSPTGNLYTVRKGDTPASIAHKYGLTVEELLAANKISNPRKLQVGQPLKLPRKG